MVFGWKRSAHLSSIHIHRVISGTLTAPPQTSLCQTRQVGVLQPLATAPGLLAIRCTGEMGVFHGNHGTKVREEDHTIS
jgi:hypothetical protein